MKVLRNDCSRLGSLREQVGCPAMHAFVVEHDWLAVFEASAEPPDVKPRFPYPEQAFEFFIEGDDGRRFFAICLAGFEDGNWYLRCFWKLARCGASWHEVPSEHPAKEGFLVLIAATVVAMESDLAETETVVAPAKINAKRAVAGKLPLNDYHRVVVKKSRCGHGGAEPYKGAVRLHFRRGHWRELDGGRVWVKWCLVGNPDLGFIDKEYRV